MDEKSNSTHSVLDWQSDATSSQPDQPCHWGYCLDNCWAWTRAWVFIGCPYFFLECPTVSLKFSFSWYEVQAIIKEPPLSTEQWPWHLSGYKESQEHQGLIAEWWLNSLCLRVGTAILPVRWKNLLLPAWPVQLLSTQEWSPLQHLLLASSSCSPYSSSRSIRGQVLLPSPSTARTIWLMEVLLWSHC